MQYLILFLGFFALIKGADIFVDGASSIAKVLKIPKVVVGLTIVSIGTSLPEASVSISSALIGANEMGFGNIIGSNIFNTAMVLGLCSLIKPINSNKEILKKEFPLMFLVAFLTLIFTLDGVLSSRDGLILTVFFAYFIVSSVINGIKSTPTESYDSKKENIFLAIVFLLVGGGLIVLGGDAVVNSAKQIALTFGLSDSVIGLTVIALGTSLPELVTSLVAARKGESDIALGNVVGSNMFNILFILGTSSTVSPILLNEFAVIDVAVFIAIAIFAYTTLIARKKIPRLPALSLVLSYVAYTVFLFIR